MSQIKEELILSGKWLYDKSIEQEVHIIKTNFKPGSGDHEDEAYIREDQFGEFYGIHVGAYSDLEVFLGGVYSSIEKAKTYALKVCPSLTWNKHESST
ncbi:MULTISPECIES: hypothetical protein [unclassified Pseudoalteromonas]|uniref:hypothetical protein n=1 Tax=unclassified Pseudoalteromonas TaxID=194690 RepID=UPI0015FED230|nr:MULTISPECIES: hypothetical protein [unclassified Pseudoalteromonas]MBB1335551.1 hypothetical protein [Pseudoalteromonas sp. SR41-6]MBB1343826.1 hypothetical protein [Pseudoalteromonas sp. SR45-6]MBB1461114.1 hypothetical protein [Pseudoalteromonas sp. SG41-8]